MKLLQGFSGSTLISLSNFSQMNPSIPTMLHTKQKKRILECKMPLKPHMKGLIYKKAPALSSC